MAPNKPFALDPDSLAPAFLSQVAASVSYDGDLSDDARLRCLRNLQDAEKRVYLEIVNYQCEQQAKLVVQIAQIKSETTCLNKKI